MIDLAEARATVLERCRPLPVVEAALSEAVGCVLAEAVHAAEDVPPFANSAVDGYALRAGDLSAAGTELRVVGEVAAGQAASRAVEAGEAIRIMTGAPIPAGADAVAMVEDTTPVGEDRVHVRVAVPTGSAVRPAGDDLRRGDIAVPAGTLISGPVAGVLASANAARVRVVPRVTVGLLSTGDELVDDHRPLRPGEIRETNRIMLAQLLREAGATVVDHGIVADDEETLTAVLREAAARCDAIVTSGGVSMGDYDVVKAVLARIAEMRWMQIAIKPAKPFAFGLLDGTPVFGLPGNPVSSMVSFELLARPALLAMMGRPVIDRPVAAAVADTALGRRPDGKTHFVRAIASLGADGRVHVRPVAAQGSHQLFATASANCLVTLPDGVGVEAGDTVEARWWSLEGRAEDPRCG